MYIDSHTHLNSPKLFENWKEHVLDFEKIGGKYLVNTGADDEYNKNGLIISKEYKGKCFVGSTIGYHPSEAIFEKINKENIEDEIEKLKSLYLKNTKYIVAIGEAGIDTHYDGEKKLELQKELLEMQCKLAEEFNLPIVIHSRDDFDSTIEVLEKYKYLKIYFHCRGYGPEEIEKIQNTFENVWIGFCGNISYPKAQNIRDSLRVTKLNNILLETDAPYLPPQQFRGKTNYPSYVKEIYNFVGEEIKINNNELQKIVKENFQRLYIK
ncbi:MAG TPA: TatD family hydrolase [Candidatus Absconditabacterales bacterium]|nr:TatD family hydrolase [Candidatus Absconditabacterales bacterium]